MREVASVARSEPRAVGERQGRPLPRRWAVEISAIAAIAHRDFVKLLRDRLRLFSELSFPLILIVLLGPSLQAGFGAPGGLDLTTFVFAQLNPGAYGTSSHSCEPSVAAFCKVSGAPPDAPVRYRLVFLTDWSL